MGGRSLSVLGLEFAPSSLTIRQAEQGLLDLLDEAVKLHMISDVPVGFLLSGGVDSTAMLSCSAGKSNFPLSSYTLGFTAPGITDERPYARLAADTYGSEHHEMTISFQDFQDFLPQYMWHMEEPVCEPPAIALYYVSGWRRTSSRYSFQAKAAMKLLVDTKITAAPYGQSG